MVLKGTLKEKHHISLYLEKLPVEMKNQFKLVCFPPWGKMVHVQQQDKIPKLSDVNIQRGQSKGQDLFFDQGLIS